MISCLPVQFDGQRLRLLDQRKLPGKEVFLDCASSARVRQAVADMAVRGAPCIGFSGIFGLALAAKELGEDYTWEKLKEEARSLKDARPTAVNLAYEVDRALEKAGSAKNGAEAARVIADFGRLQMELSEINNRKMANFAIEDLDRRLGKKTYNILTHCNTGFLACGSLGTALGVIQVLGERNRLSNVLVDETRPYLQGSRLTAFELEKLGLPYQIVVEGAANYLMKRGLVDAVFTGADRIVSNGDTANKIGTSNLAIIAKERGVPFYVAAPESSFDLGMKSGEEIEIELRDGEEALYCGGVRVAPPGARALNPSFDVTENKHITAIVSERGVATAPFDKSLSGMFSGKSVTGGENCGD